MANLLDDGTVWDARNDIIGYRAVYYPKGVQRREAGYLHEEAREYAIFQAPAWTHGRPYEAWVKALESQAGKPYDSVGIWDFVKGMVTGQYEDYNYAPSNPSESKAWFCDEYAVWAAMTAGILPPITVPIFTLTPGSALNLFIGAGWQLIEHVGDL